MGRAAKIGIAVVGALALVFCIGSYIVDRQALDETYARHTDDGPTMLLRDADVAAEHPFADVSFELDGQTLRGHVYGESNDRGLVVFRHGIFSQHQDYLALITALVDKGWKAFAYDAIGCGESDGDSVLGFSQSPIDVHAAVQFARESGMADGLPIVLFGHSWGGYGVAAALSYDDGVAGCVTMSGFDLPEGIILESTAAEMGALAYTQLPFLKLIEWQDFGQDAARSAARAIDESGLPVLVIHGAGDGTVRLDGSSIMARRDSISNPEVRYIVKDEPGRDGHNTYFYTAESWEYFDECAQELSALQAEYDGAVPQAQLDACFAGVDKKRANTADPVLIEQVDSFFAHCVGEDNAVS
ncbi:MAG: alpha/beta fold hydrolase [Coriobacteriaceae bacterium]|nr:alpha/beta fold hydrolase [Coriobacteriaceae bacterium]